jgi:calpain-7
MPAFNPCGKYMVKLFFNGVWRKVVIDDYLPVSYGTSLLCTHTIHPGELWVSLIEKA